MAKGRYLCRSYTTNWNYRQFEQDVQSLVNTSSEDRVPAIRREIEELVWALYKRGTEPVAAKSAAFRVNAWDCRYPSVFAP